MHLYLQQLNANAMKLYKENINYSSADVVVKEEYFAFNDFPFHYHPELELILILKGSGQRFVGDNIAEFNSDELYLFGANLPHTFYNKHLAASRDIHQVVVQFDEHFLGNGFFEKPAFKLIKLLLENAKKGYCFSKKTVQLVYQKIKRLVQLDETEVVIELLSILDILSKSGSHQFITSAGYNINIDGKDSERMIAVYDYIFNNFSQDISLNKAASVACLSPEAFCRYFKKHTRKKFSEFLIEVRIGNACKLLQENKMGIQQISLHCGFNNISYFNRKFKMITQKTPAEYRSTFVKKSFDILSAEMFEAVPN